MKRSTHSLLIACALTLGCADDSPADVETSSTGGDSESPEPSDADGTTTATPTTSTSGSAPASSSESSGSDGSDLVDACLGDDDQARLAEVDAEAIAGDCGQQNIGNVDGVVQCVIDQTQLSMDCASCFGDTVGCVFASCLPGCLDPESTECVECRAQNCDGALVICSGLDPSES